MLDRSAHRYHDDTVVEYGSITAALAILVSSLAGVLGSVGAFPATDLKGAALVSTVARTHHLSVLSEHELPLPALRPALQAAQPPL